MHYFLIAGEASGDLHAAQLILALRRHDPEARFTCYGGGEMERAGATLLRHYKDLAYMGFLPVLLHLRTILRGMADCRRTISESRPDAVILVDYPGFNLKIAKYVRKQSLCPVFYYISPKIWAWKEHRIRAIRRDVSHLYSILPFEVDFFEKKHHYPITYVGNPTVDEVDAFLKSDEAATPPPAFKDYIALLPGSRHQEITANLSRMLRAVAPITAEKYRVVIAAAPAIPAALYDDIVRRSGINAERVSIVAGQTYATLRHATAALVTSGTATLETALFRVPQVVCYYVSCGWLVKLLRRLFLKVPYVSLVNLVCGREVVPELIASDMNTSNLRRHLLAILPDGAERTPMLRGYDEMATRLGAAGAPARAAADIARRLL